MLYVWKIFEKEKIIFEKGKNFFLSSYGEILSS